MKTKKKKKPIKTSKRGLLRLRPKRKLFRSRAFGALVFAAAFAGIGVFMLTRSSATTPFTSKKVRVLYVYPKNSSLNRTHTREIAKLKTVVSDIREYYKKETGKNFNLEGSVQATRSKYTYYQIKNLCLNGEKISDGCAESPDTGFNPLLTAMNGRFRSEFKKDGYLTVVISSLSDHPDCSGIAGPVAAGYDDPDVSRSSYTTMFAPRSCTDLEKFKRTLAHEIGHGFGLVHTCKDGTLMEVSTASSCRKISNDKRKLSEVPLKNTHAQMLRDSSKFFNKFSISNVGNSTFTPLNPVRLLDSRGGFESDVPEGSVNGTTWIKANSATKIKVHGRFGVPSTAKAAAINLTAVNPKSNGRLVAYACDEKRPTDVSSINYREGQNISNGLIVSLGKSGSICVYTNAVTDMTVDMTGYMTSASYYRTVTPSRLVDTRQSGRIKAGKFITVGTKNKAGVSGVARAVSVNVTSINASRDGYLTVYPCGKKPVVTSGLYKASDVRGSSVVTDVNANGEFCVFSSRDVDVTVDINGYFTNSSKSKFRQLSTPKRIIRHLGKSGGTVINRYVLNRDGVSGDAIALTYNLNISNPSSNGFVTIYPCNEPRPIAASMVVRANNGGYSNSGTVKIDSGGRICIYTSDSLKRSDVRLDITGYVRR